MRQVCLPRDVAIANLFPGTSYQELFKCQMEDLARLQLQKQIAIDRNADPKFDARTLGFAAFHHA